MTKHLGDTRSVLEARVLVVEDENIIARDIAQTLKTLGYTVVGIVDTGEAAIASAERERPDLILVDIRIRGEIDGILAAERIREKADIPVVFLTAFADAATLERASRAAPYGYVLKPFEDRELQAAIMMALAKHEAFRQLDQRVKERTEALLTSEARSRQLTAVAELGLFALGEHELGDVLSTATRIVRDTLELDCAAVLELATGETGFVVRAPTGSCKAAEGATLPIEATTHAGYALARNEPVACESYASERRFEPLQGFMADGVVSAIMLPICQGDSTYGVLAAGATEPRAFASGQAAFLQAVATLLATTMTRLRADERRSAAERRAERERLNAAQAEEALRERDEFLSIASHELRTPITAIHLQIQALAHRTDTLDPTARTAIARATRSVDRLARLVSDLLDVSRLSTGLLELARSRADLNTILNEAMVPLLEEARRACCELRVQYYSGPLEGWWDEGRVIQVISNLVTNAIKYGGGHPVEISLERVDAAAELRVRDYGPGLAPNDAERIFDRFERATSSRHYGGLGLGLYISRQIARQHGGTIAVETAPGAGCTFTLTLPLSRPEEGQPNAAGEEAIQ